jgi:hypothetical protein
VTPDTRLGFALAGGSTNWTLSQGLGTGQGQAVMAGVHGKTSYGPVYLTGSLAAAEHWMSTDRMALGDHLTAQFDAQSYGGRIEGGYRFASRLGGIAPYAAAQFQSSAPPATPRPISPAAASASLTLRATRPIPEESSAAASTARSLRCVRTRS